MFEEIRDEMESKITDYLLDNHTLLVSDAEREAQHIVRQIVMKVCGWSLVPKHKFK